MLLFAQDREKDECHKAPYRFIEECCHVPVICCVDKYCKREELERRICYYRSVKLLIYEIAPSAYCLCKSKAGYDYIKKLPKVDFLFDAVYYIARNGKYKASEYRKTSLPYFEYGYKVVGIAAPICNDVKRSCAYNSGNEYYKA